MRTVKWNPFLSGVCAVLAGVALSSGVAVADVTSTSAAAIVIYPKLLVNTTESNFQLDTLIQLTNTAANAVNVRCYYVNANGHCSNNGLACNPYGDPADNPCGSAQCVAAWVETDFALRLSPKQPLVWQLSKGLAALPLANIAGPNGQFNSGSIPPSPEDPMIGELKCVEVGDQEQPINANDLIGEATIETGFLEVPDDSTFLDVDSDGYNAIGIQAAGPNNGDDTLVLDGTEYNACPNLLVLDHFFDNAVLTTSQGEEDEITTDVTFVPCSEDFLLQRPVANVVQFLVYNEFEQRFSTSRKFTCLAEIQLSNIDTRLSAGDNTASIFNVAVQGTLTGQTVMRGVVQALSPTLPPLGNGILVVAEEFHHDLENDAIKTGAYIPAQRGKRPNADYIYLSPVNQ